MSHRKQVLAGFFTLNFVCFAGLLSAIKVQGAGATLKDQRIVVCGAGSAGMGVAAAVHAAMVKEGCTEKV